MTYSKLVLNKKIKNKIEYTNVRLEILKSLLNPYKVKNFIIETAEVSSKSLKPVSTGIKRQSKIDKKTKQIWGRYLSFTDKINKKLIPIISFVLVLPIIGLLMYLLVDMGLIGTGFYSYHKTYQEAVVSGDNEYITKFFLQRPTINMVESPIAEQMALYGGTRKRLNDIYAYYDNGYKSYNDSKKLYEGLSGNVDYLNTDDSSILFKTLGDYFNKPGLYQSLKLDSNSHYIIGMCNVHPVIDVNLQYKDNIFTARDTFMTNSTENLKIVYVPMEKDLGCFLIKRNDSNLAIYDDLNAEYISDLIIQDKVNADNLDLVNFAEEQLNFNIIPFDILTSYINTKYINYIIKENRLTYDSRLLNTLNIVHFVFDSKEGDFKKQTDLNTSNIDVSGILEIIDSEANTLVEGEDYIIGEDGRVQGNVGIPEEETEESDESTESDDGNTINSKKKKEDFDLNTLSESDFADVSDEENENVITGSETFISDYAFIIKDMKQNRIILLGVKY